MKISDLFLQKIGERKNCYLNVLSLSDVKHLSKFLVLNQKGLLRQDNNLNSDFWTQVRRSESLSQKFVSH